MNNVYKVINNVPTHLITWGNPFDCNGQDVIVCITGNPGITDFYIEFGTELHELTSLPVCVIGHAGHEEIPEQKSPKLKGQEHLFNLKGQVEHKLDLLRNHIDKNSKVHMIGHSIGAWMIIELVHKNDFMQTNILTTNLMFPTIQKMAESKNGIFLNTFVRPLHSIILFCAFFVNMLPVIVFNFFIFCYLKIQGFPSKYFTRIQKFLNHNAVEKVLFLAYDEMDTVLKLNIDGIEKLCPQTNVIYSMRDNWAPLNYMKDLKNVKPSLQMKEVNISHAFVLKSSERVANMVSEYIKPNISLVKG
ncbi:lipid droplet-associated hydrolase [Epargyreus clarus]|uniref:lipid droplet-associated hydrolase n=1 Tax=Epargyreus clarus TaxID=520877 RepID=UPI003C2DEFC0